MRDHKDSVYYPDQGRNYLCTRDEVTGKTIPLRGPMSSHEVVALINAQRQPGQYFNKHRYKLDCYDGFTESRKGEQALQDLMNQNAYRLESMDRLGCVLHISPCYTYAYAVCFTLSADKTRLERHFIHDRFDDDEPPAEYSPVDGQSAN